MLKNKQKKVKVKLSKKFFYQKYKKTCIASTKLSSWKIMWHSIKKSLGKLFFRDDNYTMHRLCIVN